MFRFCIVLGLVAVAIAHAPLRQPTRPPPELHFAYANLVGEIEPWPEAPTAVKLTTAEGEVVLLPNRFEALVGALGGREVEVEGLLIAIGEHVLLWIEAIHWEGATSEPPLLRPRPREIPL
jgi:hypothetical protein